MIADLRGQIPVATYGYDNSNRVGFKSKIW